MAFLLYWFFYTLLIAFLAYREMKYVRLEPYLFPFHASAGLTLAVNEVWIWDTFLDGISILMESTVSCARRNHRSYLHNIYINEGSF